MAEIELPPGMTEANVQRILKAAEKKQNKPSGENYVEFARFESGNEQEIRVYRDIFKKHEMFSIRRFYLDPIDGWKPGKGVTFKDEDIDEIVTGLEKMREWAGENADIGDD